MFELSLTQPTVAGFVLAAQHAPHLHLVEMSVHPDFARQGIGKTLVGRVKQETVARGLQSLTLTTFPDIPWNGPWYRRMHFKDLDDSNMPVHVAEAIEEERRAGMRQRIGIAWCVPKAAALPSGKSGI